MIRSQPIRALLALALAGLGATGCETRFVDPTPPQLTRLDKFLDVNAVDLPLAYAVILDLHLPDPGECARARDRVVSTVHALLLSKVPQLHAMRLLDLSPGCQQADERRISFTVYNAELRQAQNLYPDRPLRPLLLYFNNIDLPLTEGLFHDFERLRGEAALRNAPIPLMWATALPRTLLGGISFDATQPWTYSTDPRLFDGLNETASRQLPLRLARATPPEGALLFSEQEQSWVKAFKGCDVTPRVAGVNFVLSGEATALQPSAPPRIKVKLSDGPVLKGEARSERITFTIEACRQDCHRRYPTRRGSFVWNDVYGCMTEAR